MCGALRLIDIDDEKCSEKIDLISNILGELIENCLDIFVGINKYIQFYLCRYSIKKQSTTEYS